MNEKKQTEQQGLKQRKIRHHVHCSMTVDYFFGNTPKSGIGIKCAP